MNDIDRGAGDTRPSRQVVGDPVSDAAILRRRGSSERLLSLGFFDSPTLGARCYDYKKGYEPSIKVLLVCFGGHRMFNRQSVCLGGPAHHKDTAYGPRMEPAVIKQFVENSKGYQKALGETTPSGYVLTLLLTFSIKQVDDQVLRGYEIQADESGKYLRASTPIQNIILRSAEGILIASG